MTIDFTKNPDHLVPAIIQDAGTRKVLMLGYQNKEAFEKTLELKKVTFYSRSKQRLWTKGEESGNFL
jgi:phosphoribosyl-ATP pyrophosphohydrolase/phosphoribosyl-AMP cyclohydrolase